MRPKTSTMSRLAQERMSHVTASVDGLVTNARESPELRIVKLRRPAAAARFHADLWRRIPTRC